MAAPAGTSREVRVSPEALTDFLTKSKGVVPSARSIEEVDALVVEESTSALRARYALSAFNKLEPEKGEFGDACLVDVIAGSEPEAFKKVSQLVRRNWYWIRAVTEIDKEEHHHGGR